MNIVDLWELCLGVEYDENLLVDGLEDWFKLQPRHQSILDCACGTGFPSIKLLQKGYNVTCSDASTDMLNRFEANALKCGVVEKPVCVRWQELANHFNECFDIVMCRGSSLIYIDGWEEDAVPKRIAISEALLNFRKCLKPGGVLYVDTTTEENLLNTGPEKTKFGPIAIQGKEVYLDEVVYTDRNNNTRRWHTKVTINGVVHEFDRHSHYLPHETLIEMLQEVGFKKINKIKIKGEMYTSFEARL
ncbi:MAG TPA: class I SAM-dependent methyltransferase [Mucilaginibacter sp.]|jgi:SAM-dependent methyltransferase